MKVLLFSVTPVPSGLKAMGMENAFNGGGWVDSLLKFLPASSKQLELQMVFLLWGIDGVITAKSKDNDAITYVAIPSTTPYLDKADARMQKAYREVLQNFQPDIVHLFGTETENAHMLLRLAGPHKCLISITGVLSRYVHHYYGGIKQELKRTVTVRDLLKGSVFRYYRKMMDRVEIERRTLKEATHVSGRTDWDMAVTALENPQLQYHVCNENLRDAFYHKQWSLDTCQRYSIFSSSSASPLKGAHQLLKAMPLILKAYPKTQLYLTGNDPRKQTSFKDRLRLTGYQKYLAKLIKQLDIGDAVHFTGPLDEEAMAQNYERANVYVLPSNIENSPNSLCEAMLVGVPSVAAYVGGVPSLLQSGEEGFLYPFEEHYMLAYRVMQIFSDEALAKRFSENARKRATVRHDRIRNATVMAEIYEQIAKQGNSHA